MAALGQVSAAKISHRGDACAGSDHVGVTHLPCEWVWFALARGSVSYRLPVTANAPYIFRAQSCGGKQRERSIGEQVADASIEPAKPIDGGAFCGANVVNLLFKIGRDFEAKRGAEFELGVDMNQCRVYGINTGARHQPNVEPASLLHRVARAIRPAALQ